MDLADKRQVRGLLLSLLYRLNCKAPLIKYPAPTVETPSPERVAGFSTFWGVSVV
jgi:hypothetical protein